MAGVVDHARDAQLGADDLHQIARAIHRDGRQPPKGSWMLLILPEVALYESVVARKIGSVTELTRPLPS